MIEFSFATDMISKLSELYKGKREERNNETSSIVEELFIDPTDLAPLFIEPDIQPFNPADENEKDEDDFRVSSFKHLESFIKTPRKADGRRQLFLLGDAGMGKSSLLAMFKLGHIKKFWPSGYDCKVLKLRSDTLIKLPTIKNKNKTVLLLDALDEDPAAYGRIKLRLVEILGATKDFLRVIITCRTQFFPKTDDPIFYRQDRVKINGFTCPVRYLSLFNEAQVDRYLLKRFNDHKKREKAKSLINTMGDLSLRPMLLAYVDDLIDSKFTNIYQVYDCLVKVWLARENRKTGLDESDLLTAVQYLARYMMIHKNREISEEKLEKVLKESEIRKLKLMDVGGRSLLNKNSDGEYRFAHLSFQEFLTVKSINNLGWINPNTELMWRFLKNIECVKADLKEIDLEGENLSGINFSGADMAGINLSHTDLSRATLPKNLTGVCFYKAILRETSLVGADLKGANFEGADLRKTNLTEAKLLGANITVTTILLETNLSGVDLNGFNIQNFNLHGVNLSGADLRMTNLEGANLRNADLSSSNLSGACLKGADLSGSCLSNSNLRNVDLRQADLRNSEMNNIQNLKKIRYLSSANITGVKMAPFGFKEWALTKGAELDPKNQNP